jgi:hypothetical protein
MFFVLAIYLGTIFYSVKKVLEYAKCLNSNIEPFLNEVFELDREETIPQKQNLSLYIEIDKENVLYQAFNNEITNNQLDTTKKVLICCTGDNQSMALLTIAMNIFNKENIHVITFGCDNEPMLEFMENICNENKLTFYHSKSNIIDSESDELCGSDGSDKLEKSNDESRCTQIKDIMKNNEIDYVFEAHTLVNYSNQILNDLFNNKKTINDLVVYRPFLLIDNITLLRFFSIYNIPIDETLSHLENSKEERQKIFNDMEPYFSFLYPNWRLNVVENNKNILNIDDLKKNCYNGKHGFSVEHNFNRISFVMFKKLVDELSNEYKFERINTDNLDELYMNDDNKTIFVSENYLDKISLFERYLLSIDLQDLIEELIEKKSNISDNSFEELDTIIVKSEQEKESEQESEQEKESEQEQEQKSDKSETTEEKEASASALETETKDVSNEVDKKEIEEKEYILRVDLNNYILDMKIVDNISDNFKNEYLEGIIYVSIENDNYHIWV